MPKLTVVWICNFTNKEIQGIIKPYRSIIEYGFWIPEALKVVENDDRFDIHVISPHYWIKEEKHIQLRRINYYFFNPFINTFRRLFHNKYYDVADYNHQSRNTKIITRLVNKIRPNIIHLIGAENAPYAASILKLADSYPIIFSAQGFISFADQSKMSYHLKQSVRIEQEVIRKIDVAFFRSKTEADNIRLFNPNMIFSWYTFSSLEIPRPTTSQSKDYDIVFFARICKDKGIIDLLDAVVILKKTNPDIRLCVIGSGNIQEYKNYAEEKKISDNIVWAGFQPTRSDVHKLALHGKVAVLPTYHDMFPGLIVESMFLGIPVVSYDIPCNQEINENGEVIKLAPKGNVELLADYILDFLNDSELANHYIELANKRAYELFVHSNEKLSNALYTGYQLAIETFTEKSNI